MIDWPVVFAFSIGVIAGAITGYHTGATWCRTMLLRRMQEVVDADSK